MWYIEDSVVMCIAYTALCIVLQSGQVAKGLAFRLTHTVCPITSHLVPRTMAVLHDSGKAHLGMVVVQLGLSGQ